MAKEIEKKTKLWTPPGRISFPFFTAPDVGRSMSDGKFKTDLLIPKGVFTEQGKELQAVVLEVGRDKFGSKFSLRGEWKIPFKDTDTDPKIPDNQKGCILVRAKSKIAPKFIGPKNDSETGKPIYLSHDQVAALKGGDYGKLYVYVYTYEQKGGGVTLGLNGFQFWKTGEGFGQGSAQLLDTATEFEDEEIEDAEMPTDSDSDSSDSFI